jgi:hypothetical protein
MAFTPHAHTRLLQVHCKTLAGFRVTQLRREDVADNFDEDKSALLCREPQVIGDRIKEAPSICPGPRNGSRAMA